MKYELLFGWGIAMYAVMYLLSSGLLIYGIVFGLLPVILKFAALIAVAAIAGRSVRAATWQDVLPYSIGWMLIIAFLDAVFWMPFAGLALYASYGVWIGYLLVVVTPPIAVCIPARVKGAAAEAQ